MPPTNMISRGTISARFIAASRGLSSIENVRFPCRTKPLSGSAGGTPLLDRSKNCVGSFFCSSDSRELC
jgi:hypothetical protein